MRMRGSCKAHEEKGRKKFVGQRLGVTPKSWLLIWSFVVFWLFFYMTFSSSWTKIPYNHDFWMFSIVFKNVNACASMRLLVKIHNINCQKLTVGIWNGISQCYKNLFGIQAISHATYDLKNGPTVLDHSNTQLVWCLVPHYNVFWKSWNLFLHLKQLKMT